MKKTYKILCECRCCGDRFIADFVFDPDDVASSFVVEDLDVYDPAAFHRRVSEVFFREQEEVRHLTAWLKSGGISVPAGALSSVSKKTMENKIRHNM